jgi:NADPH-ferrihemoprotein reductase
MEEFDPDDFKRHKCVVLVVATYGEGDPTDNSIEFFKWLQDSDLPDDTLAGMNFTVFGLGNRQYVNFNACARAADKHMERIGAHRIYAKGEGDDDQNLEEDFEVWREGGLWPALQATLGVSPDSADAAKGQQNDGLENMEQVIAKLPLKANICDVKSAKVDPLVQVGGSDVVSKWYFASSLAPVSVERELLQQPDVDAGSTTKHIDFDIKSFPAFDWRTADNLEVLVENTEENVEWFAKRLGVYEELDLNVSFVRAEGIDKVVRKPFPTPCSVRKALSLYCDLVMAPGKMPAKRLAAFIKDEQDRAAVQSLLEDREAWQWVTGENLRLTLREFFELYMASAEIDFSSFSQICPRNKNRPYTIASSSREDPKTIGICVSMVQEKLLRLTDLLDGLASRGHAAPHAAAVLEQNGASVRLFRGLCSTALCTRVEKADKLWIYARASSFRLPRKNTTPIIMIAAGTGMAPFRGFLQEFKKEGGVRQKTILFFGCRRENEDFLYKDELQEALEAKPPYLTELITAFSREQEKKVYVQDRLEEHGAKIADLLLKEAAYLYVCGSTAMGGAVHEVLAGALGSKDQVDRLQKEGRIVEELW